MERSPLALAFDMDGLLLDTERVARDVFVAACERNDFEIHDLSVYYRCIGTVGNRSSEIMREGYGPEFPLDAVMATWGELYREHAIERAVPVKAGARALLATAAQLGLATVLVTSTREVHATMKLQHADLLGHFEQRVCGDHVVNGKPDPEPYKKAATLLGIPPEAVVALEDSANGVRAALGAGMRVVQVPDLVAPDAELRSLGHVVMQSLDEVDAWLGRLARRDD